MGRLTGKVAIITGSAQGIGAAYAQGFAKEGAKIVIADVLDGQKAVEDIKKAGGEAIYVKTDVTDQAQCDAMAAAAKERFGRVDILVNNAAVFGSIVMKPFTEYTTKEFMKVLEINVVGQFHCMKAVFPFMKDKGGKIVNIGSSSINEGVPGMPHYVASKGAIMALTRSMAREMGDFKINVNTIAPGFTHSEGGNNFDKNKAMDIPPLETLQLNARCLKREAVPEDLIGLALFLSTDDSAFITGQMIVHDGGLSFH
ncbi:SDR family NAD(P)-dependent oxidoreductase [Citrifermentans bremense]|uniref:SDR family NAD(P)-dependent oxidoreductase n=1 Tax=Citrifermentans bremense TaxID=60035 RepID=UPI000416A9FC|nr:SDR family oxidoreductase [Citrifermentans bremense]